MSVYLSIVIPLYNEEESIPPLVSRLVEVLRAIDLPYSNPPAPTITFFQKNWCNFIMWQNVEYTMIKSKTLLEYVLAEWMISL